jgi:hypothetical protein
MHGVKSKESTLSYNEDSKTNELVRLGIICVTILFLTLIVSTTTYSIVDRIAPLRAYQTTLVK